MNMKPSNKKCESLNNFLVATGRVLIDKDSLHPASLPFSQISYSAPNEAHKLGSIIFQLIENGCQLMDTSIEVERMNVTKYDIGGTKIVEIHMLDTGKNVEVIFE